MDQYIFSIIKVGGILIGGVLIFFVLWYIIKDVMNLKKNDRD
ncbi:hypothetical protein [Parabacteroides sp. AM08-6]|nr:hypothetical protein [Parabacteroides sp. AM08-6]